MSNAVKWGLLLGVLVEAWTAVYIVARWYTDPFKMLLFFLVIPLEIVLLVLALRGTSKTSGYGGQFLNGTVFSAVAAAIVFCGSYLLTTVVFKSYFADARSSLERLLVAAGRTPEQVSAEMAKNAGQFEPFQNSLSGAIGTIATGVIVSLVTAAILRRRT